MAARIRLTRKGTKKRPFYRIVVAHSEAPRDGKFLEIYRLLELLNEQPQYGRMVFSLYLCE